MNTYYQLSDEKKKEMYLAVEPYLTISDLKTVEENFKSLNEKCLRLEKVVNHLKEQLSENTLKVPIELNENQKTYSII